MNTLSTGALCKVDLKKDLLKKLPSPSPAKMDESESGLEYYKSDNHFLIQWYCIN